MMTSAADFDHPAFAHTPTLVREKLSKKAVDIIKRVHHWVETECVPAEPIVKAQLEQHGRWKIPPLIRQLREKAKKQGLFNLFLPKTFGDLSPGLTNLEYSCCCEIMGRVSDSARNLKYMLMILPTPSGTLGCYGSLIPNTVLKKMQS